MVVSLFGTTEISITLLPLFFFVNIDIIIIFICEEGENIENFMSFQMYNLNNIFINPNNIILILFSH